jgi:hypothetical protein
MSTPAASGQGQTTEGNTGWYVYGIVPGDSETNGETQGVGDPPGKVELVRHGDIAAMVSEVRTDTPLGTPQDLMAHQRLLDATASVAPVLPLRFGAVLADKDAVAEELLAAHHDEFQAALQELEGVAEYIVKGRYEESAVLSEVLSENPEASRLREQIKDQPEEVTQGLRISLGELINQAVSTKREQDTQAVVEELGQFARFSALRDPAHELDAVHIAFLVETERQKELEHAVEELAERSKGRMQLRLLGPLAAYDFVTTAQQAG